MNRDSIGWRGYIPAITTVFDKDGVLDPLTIRQLCRWLAGEKMHGVIALGTQGEWFSLNGQERREVLQIVSKELKGRMTIIAGCSGFTAKEVIASAGVASELGFDGVMVTPPLRMALDRPRAALISLQYAIEIYDHPLYRETQAKAFLMLDRLEEAEETLLRLVNLTDARFDIPIVFVRAHYYLGTVYERQGRIRDAMNMYARFLEFWGETEAPVIEVRNAREAVSRLAQSSQGS